MLRIIPHAWLLILGLCAPMAMMSCAMTPGMSDQIQADGATKQNYDQKLNKIFDAIRNNPDYKRIPFKDEDMPWFGTLGFLLWKHKITEEKFIHDGLSRYPGYEESFTFLAHHFAMD